MPTNRQVFFDYCPALAASLAGAFGLFRQLSLCFSKCLLVCFEKARIGYSLDYPVDDKIKMIIIGTETSFRR